MSGASFTKLFSSITESTVWGESHATRIVWITMLAMADRKGRVHSSIPGLANRARVTLEECEHALERFLAPDRYSRTPDNDGRRIEPMDGGWQLLNYAKYREMRDAEARKDYMRDYMQDRRKHEKLTVSHGKPGLAKAEAEAEAEKNKTPLPPSGAFLRFWSSWPPHERKESKGKCWEVWRKKDFDQEADKILSHVDSLKSGERWRGGYVPAPLTYLNQRRWEGADDSGKNDTGERI